MGGTDQDRLSSDEIVLETVPATSALTYEAWCKDGNLHRDDGPAVTWRDAATGVITRVEWWKDGNLHRDKGPAVLWRDATTGIIPREERRKEDDHASAEGPGRHPA
jgi:hypothetical protein